MHLKCTTAVSSTETAASPEAPPSSVRRLRAASNAAPVVETFLVAVDGYLVKVEAGPQDPEEVKAIAAKAVAAMTVGDPATEA